jgi:hypothetical protein
MEGGAVSAALAHRPVASTRQRIEMLPRSARRDDALRDIRDRIVGLETGAGEVSGWTWHRGTYVPAFDERLVDRQRRDILTQ